MTDPLRALERAALATEPPPEALQRLLLRLDRPIPARTRSNARPAALGLLLAVAAAVAAFTLRGAWVEEAPSVERLETSRPTSFRPADHVELTLTGSGELRGTRSAPSFQLEDGLVEVLVRPGRGRSFVVETPEARATVHGTRFTVSRDLLGTEVRVAGGRVGVACIDAEEGMVEAGGRVECLPARPAGLLGRARALRDQSRPQEALETLASLLERSGPEDPARGEGLALQVQIDVMLSREEDAMLAAHRYLAEGHLPRADEMRDFLDARQP